MRGNTILILILSWFLIGLLSSCRKDPDIVPDNNIPDNNSIPRTAIENYVNRLFIDLIGREPLDTEMQAEADQLQQFKLSDSVRLVLIKKLQRDTAWREGDTSYLHAYYQRFYDLAKVRTLEGVSDAVIFEDIGQLKSAIYRDSLNKDTFQMMLKTERMNRLKDILNIKKDLVGDSITVNQAFARLVFNDIYDEINMNTFNFINASFDNLLFRFPTKAEFSESFKMIQDGESGILMGRSGQSKGDYVHIITQSQEFYQGLVIWANYTLLRRPPTSAEQHKQLQVLLATGDLRRVEEIILKTNEYANF